VIEDAEGNSASLVALVGSNSVNQLLDVFPDVTGMRTHGTFSVIGLRQRPPSLFGFETGLRLVVSEARELLRGHRECQVGATTAQAKLDQLPIYRVNLQQTTVF
jgi:hypothetical protein